MMKTRQNMKSLPLLTILLGMLCWGAVNPVEAGPTRSRFDRSYPTIGKLVPTETPRSSLLSTERTPAARIVERWVVSVPPWHQAAMNLELPVKPDRTGLVARLPDSNREPIETEAYDGGDDGDEEPTMTDYDYQEWLSARVVPNPDKGS